MSWLIEWPANKQYPRRYYAAGEPYVIDPNDATRFSRKQDAQAFIKAERMTQGGAEAVEHLWMPNVRSVEV